MNIKQINESIEEGLSLKLISQAYTEISSNKLKRIREAVERNRYYLDELSNVHQVVKHVANIKHILPQKNNKTVSVLVTSNYHFYGNVNNTLISYFLNAMKQHSTDQVVIGKTGIEHLNGIKYNLHYQPFILQTDYPTLEELNQLVTLTKNYSQILVYHAQLKTVMVQVPIARDITQTSYLKPISPEEENKPAAFIFEPEINKILDFFESQVTNLLLEQTFLESELARTASRLISMDQAQSSADKYITDQKKLLGIAKRSLTNSKILETYSTLASLRKSTYDGK